MPLKAYPSGGWTSEFAKPEDSRLGDPVLMALVARFRGRYRRLPGPKRGDVRENLRAIAQGEGVRHRAIDPNTASRLSQASYYLFGRTGWRHLPDGAISEAARLAGAAMDKTPLRKLPSGEFRRIAGLIRKKSASVEEGRTWWYGLDVVLAGELIKYWRDSKREEPSISTGKRTPFMIFAEKIYLNVCKRSPAPLYIPLLEAMNTAGKPHE